jgi:hypothetical protein
MHKNQGPAAKGYVFHCADGSSWPNSHLGWKYSRTLLKNAFRLRASFVVAYVGTRLGESGADAFTIMRLMGHSTVTVHQRYVHPSPEALELAYQRMRVMNLRRLPHKFLASGSG